MLKRFAVTPPVAALIALPLLLNVSLCSVCSLLGPSEEEPAQPPVETGQTAAPPEEEAPAGAAPGIPLEATYDDPEGFFSIHYPAAWRTNEAGSEMQFWADEQGDAAFAASLKIKATSPDSMIEGISSLLAGRFDNYREISRQETSIDGRRAVWIEQAYDRSGAPQGGFIAGVVRNRVGYLLLGYAPAEQYPGLAPTFRAIAQSLRVAEFAEAPPYEQWLTHSSRHFVFHYLPDTFVARDIATVAEQHEQVFESNVGWLGVTYHGPIRLYFYPSGASLYRATARDSGFAINEATEVHALWVAPDDHQSLGHEMTHVITYWTLAEPSEALLGEGIAVCLDHAQPHPHARAAALMSAGRLVSLRDALGDDWFGHDPSVMYPQSGSFVCWLAERYGTDRFTQIYARGDFPAALEEIYGFDLGHLEQEWRAMLETF